MAALFLSLLTTMVWLPHATCQASLHGLFLTLYTVWDKGVGLGLRQTWTKIPAYLLLIDVLDFGVNVTPAPYILMSVRASFSLLARVPVTQG